MSVDLIVYLPRGLMPSPQGWNQAIRDAGFPVQLDTDFDPDSFSGFLPCTFGEEETGFEYYSGRIGPSQQSELQSGPANDFQVILTTHADLNEFSTALIAASVLCHQCGGLLCDPQSGDEIPASEVLDWARKQLASLEEEWNTG